MKKVLLTACVALATMTASAEVYSFIAEGCAPFRAAQANQTHVTMIPLGYYGMGTDETAVKPTIATHKALVNDAVMIEDMAEGNILVYGSWRMLKDVPVKITPATGLTITNIKIKGSVPNYTQTLSIINPKDDGFDIVEDFNLNKADTLVTWEGSKAEPFQVACTTGGSNGNYYMRAIWIEFTVSGTSTQVGVPVCNKTIPMVAKNEPISFSCSTEGADIYYTVSYDGSEEMPTTASTPYTGPFTLEKNAVVRAIAVKDGMTNSFPTYNEFVVAPENSAIVAKFDFTDFQSLTLADGNKLSPEDMSIGYPFTGTTKASEFVWTDKSFVDNGYTLTGNGIDASQIIVSGAYGLACEFCTTTTKNAGFVFEAPAGAKLKGLFIQGSYAKSYKLAADYPGTFSSDEVNAANHLWTAPVDESVNTTSIVSNASGKRYMSRVYVLAEGSTTGIDNIEAGIFDENAPVEYYNLQGIRVTNPTNGIFIKRQGSKVSKLFVK